MHVLTDEVLCEIGRRLRAAVAAIASDVLGRHIDSGTELSQADADAVAASLEEDLRRAKEDHPAGTGIDPETGEVAETIEEQK